MIPRRKRDEYVKNMNSIIVSSVFCIVWLNSIDGGHYSPKIGGFLYGGVHGPHQKVSLVGGSSIIRKVPCATGSTSIISASAVKVPHSSCHFQSGNGYCNVGLKKHYYLDKLRLKKTQRIVNNNDCYCKQPVHHQHLCVKPIYHHTGSEVYCPHGGLQKCSKCL